MSTSKLYLIFSILLVAVSFVNAQKYVGLDLSNDILSLAYLDEQGDYTVSPHVLGNITDNLGYSIYSKAANLYVYSNVNPPAVNFLDLSNWPPTNKSIIFGSIKIIGHTFNSEKVMSVIAGFDNSLDQSKEINIYNINYVTNEINLLYGIGITGNWTFLSNAPMYLDDVNSVLYIMAFDTFLNVAAVFSYSYSSGHSLGDFETGSYFSSIEVDSSASYLYGSGDNGLIMKFDLSTSIGTTVTSSWCAVNPTSDANDNITFDLVNDMAYAIIKCNGVSTLYSYDFAQNSISSVASDDLSNIFGVQVLPSPSK